MAEYYVDPAAGDNTNDGSTTALAWATRAYAETQISAGDIVYCMATATDTESSIGVALHSYWVGVNASGVEDGTKYVCAGHATDPTFISETAVNGGVYLRNFDFESAGTPLRILSACGIQVTRCLADGGSPYFISNAAPSTNAVPCYIYESTISGITTAVYENGNNRTMIGSQIGNTYISCAQLFIAGWGGTSAGTLENCILRSTPIAGSNSAAPALKNCLMYDSIITIGDRTASNVAHSFEGCVFHSSSGYAIVYVGGNVSVPRVYSRCLFYNNTSGITAATHLPDDGTILTSDPGYTNPATGDFTFGPDSPLVGAGVNGGNIGPTAYTPLTPAQIAAGVWTREGRTLTS